MTDCTAPRHGEPEPATPSAYLCRGCQSGLRRDLQRLPVLYGRLGVLYDPLCANRRGGDGDGLPYGEAASEAMSQIRHDLAWWTVHVTTMRGWNPPAGTCVPDLAGWLHGQVYWAAYRDWAGDMADTFDSDSSRARNLLDPRPRACIAIPRDVNWCPRCEVPGRLGAVICQDPGDPRQSLVSCAACGHDWTAAEWLRLGIRIISWRDNRKAAA